MDTFTADWLARRALLSPDSIALVDYATGERWTYAAFNERVNRLAEALRDRLQLRKGDRLSVLAANRPEYLDLLFAAGKLGVILAPLNWRLTVRELAVILRDCMPKALAFDAGQAEKANQLFAHFSGEPNVLQYGIALDEGGEPRPASIATCAELIAAGSGMPVVTPVDMEDPFLILYTSGTTGVPKGAVLSHRMVTWNAINTNVSWDLWGTDITPTFAPFFHSGGINVLTLPLIHKGGTVVLLRNSDPATILECIERERCTIVFAVPTVFQMLMEHPDFARTDLSSVRYCVTGGSSCPLPVIERYFARGVTFRQGYGMTEVGVNCFSLAPEDALRKAGSVGRPVFHSEARIVNGVGADVGVDEVGELIIAGPHVCSGYWSNPAATAEALRDGWFYTGDLARRDADGYYYIVGRKKDMLISGGENIYPAEIEGVLATHPAIAEVAVLGVPDPKWGEVGVAAVVAKPGQMLTEEVVLTYCQDKLARYKIPKRVIFLDALPRNAMGKVIKAELARLV
jgi:fatty-acyl-CoA synthase